MDIRTRIKKMVSGEIDVDEYEKEYTDKIRKKEADRISKSIKENTSNISINLPTQNISLPTASSRSNLKIPSYRQTSSNTTLSLPKARLDTSVDFNDLELITRKDLEARQEAERINRDIERGDYNSSISHVLNSFPEGIKSGVAGIANAGMIPLAGVLQRYSNVGQRIGILKDDNIFNKAYNSILDASDYLTDSSSYRNKVGSNISNNIVKTAGDVSLNVGQMMPAVAANLIAPGTGLVVTGLSAGGNSAQETINNDRSNLLQATLTGTAKGFVEAGTEKLTGGNIISKTGSLDNVVNKTISSKIKSNIGKEIANRGYQFVGEMAEEQISNNAGYVIDKIINNKDLPDAKQWWNDFSETNKVTFLTTLALNMVGLGGGSFSDNVDTSQYTSQELQEADKWFNEAKKIIEQENRTQNNNTEIINQLPTERNSEIVNNIANNQETLYNNIESESGINGERQNGQGTSGILGELGTRLQQEEKSQQNKKYSRTEYEQWEQSIRPITNSQLTREQQTIKQNDQRGVTGLSTRYKGRTTNGTGYQNNNAEKITRTKQQEIEYIRKPENQISKLNNNQSRIKEAFESKGTKVVFYSLNSNKGGYYDNGTLYVNENGATDIQQLNEATHEYAHYLIRNNKEFNQKIASIAEQIVQNEQMGNSEAVRNYIMDREENINVEDVDRIYKTVIEEILSDYAIDVSNDVDFSINNQYGIDIDILNKYKDIVKEYLPSVKLENSNKSSFSMEESENNIWQSYLDKNYKSTGTGQTIQEVKKAPTASDNILETSKYTQEQEKQKNEEAEEGKIAQILEQPLEKVKEKDRKWAILKANLVDKGIVFEELSHKTKNRELQGKWDYTLTANARGQNAIGQARYEMNPKTKTEKQISKSLEDIRAEVGNKVNDFQQYMYHQLNIDRMTLEERFSGDTGINYERKNAIKNKPVFGKNVTAEISRKIVKDYEKRYPQFKQWAKDVYDFNNANKQELVKSGVISQDLADRLGEMYPHYVPIKRVDTKGNAIKVPLDTNRTGINSPLARAKGGNSDIQPLFQTMADRTLQTYRASARNNFGVELMNTLNTIQNTQKTDVDTILEEIGDTESNVELLKEGKNGENSTFTVFDNGEKVTFEITKDMYDALKPINDSSILSKTFKTPNKISNFRRGVLTEYNPLFLVTNAVKDAQDVLINSQHAVKTYSKFPEAYAQIVTKGYWYKEYIRNGGEQNSYFKDGNFESDKKVNKAKKAVTIPLEKISNINNVIEMAPRLAEYIASREKGASIETAMLDAARVTTNFKAGGDVVKFANRNGATFLNASVQGAAQQVRNVVEAHTKGLKGYAVVATKYAIAGIPTLILNNLIWDDDEDYDELQDYVKDNYYIIGKYGDGKFIRIPKGRTVSIIQKIVNNISEYVSKDKEINIDNLSKDFWKDLSFASDNLAPNNPIDNNVLSPIIQTITNTSWYGEDIVPSRLQDKPNAEQYDETIDSFSIWLGEKLNQSPYKINYLLDQYGGGIGDIVLPMLTKQAENNVVEDKFTTDSVIKSKYPGEFYTKLDELTVKNNSDKATDEDKIKYKYFSSKSKEMSDLYKEKREVQGSDLSDEEKKEQIRTIQNKINQIAKTGLEQVDNLKVSNNTAQIGTEQYYKDGEGKWNILDKEEKQKNSNISTSTYADYKQKVYAQTQQKKQSGELKENQSLKDKDKIQILIDSNYSSKEKQALYENYILSDNDTTYPIIKEIFTNNGLNINKYLKYKTQEFTSDKEDDGTLSGKTVSGSKKEKVYQYVNNMDITYTQKLLLLGMEYTLNDNEQKTLVNYINSLDLTTKKKLEIYNKIKGITVYKDGTIEW